MFKIALFLFDRTATSPAAAADTVFGSGASSSSGPVCYVTLRYGTVYYGTGWYCSERYGTVRYGTVRYDTVGRLVARLGDRNLFLN